MIGAAIICTGLVLAHPSTKRLSPDLIGAGHSTNVSASSEDMLLWFSEHLPQGAMAAGIHTCQSPGGSNTILMRVCPRTKPASNGVQSGSLS